MLNGRPGRAMSAKAIVLVGERRLEMDEFPLPAIGAEDALLRVEACGLCGSDVEQYDGALAAIGIPFSTILGHEPVGTIEKIGAEASRRWSVSEGDRVVIEPLLGCGHCRSCLTGNYRICRSGREGARIAGYGFIPTSVSPALWGAYAEYMYLDPHTVLHKVSDTLSPKVAALYQPIAAGIQWVAYVAGTKVGDTVVIFGAGQRGLGAVVAAREAGAHRILVTGLRRDAHKLKLASELGATGTIVADEEDTVERVAELTNGEGADVVLDLTPVAIEPVVHAIEAAKPQGTVVLAGMKGSGKVISGFSADSVIVKELTLRGVAGQDLRAYEPALRLIESNKYPLEKMSTHTFSLEEAERAVLTLAGRVVGEESISITIAPGDGTWAS
ncbi:MAG TPA: zinc-binding dehydrogenase [Steroidobacteraceae bacterium]|nr:zinc-binding dehydrogenase [Steroidobacteraceae bacterium]